MKVKQIGITGLTYCTEKKIGGSQNLIALLSHSAYLQCRVMSHINKYRLPPATNILPLSTCGV